MKQCPTCNRTYSDSSLSFCIEDGTPLISAPDPEATVVAASTTRTAGPPGKNTLADSPTPPYQPPGQFSPAPAQRRAWPWVVGIVVLLVVGLGGLGIAAVIVIPKLIRQAGNENNSNTNSNSAGNLNDNLNANNGNNANTNSLIGNGNQNTNASPNTNANANASPAADAPTDEDEVLSDLTDLEKEWTEANFSADRKKLARILADDFVGTDPGGTIQGKQEYLRDIKPEKVKEWELRELKLTLKGDRATLKGKMRLQRTEDEDEIILQFTDKFVWRDERWQAVASEVSRVN
jgi:ketosteroid isomerase-like protein